MADHYIEFRNVTKSFDDHLVLDNVSFFVDPGETCVIMGRSGVGKSVTLKHILGFLKPDAGRVMVAGEDITDWTEDQTDADSPPRHHGFSIGRAVRFADGGGKYRVSARKPRRTSTPSKKTPASRNWPRCSRSRELLDKLPSELSTGTKRAVAIARALAQDPEAILYDEPTTMVDPLMAAHTGDLILRLKEKFHKTSVVVTHDTHLAKKLADRVVFLHEGRVAYFGPWAGFEASPEPFLRNFRLQDELIPALDATL